MAKLVLIGALVLGSAAPGTVGYHSHLGLVSVTPGFEVSEARTVSISAGGGVVARPSIRKVTGNEVEALVVVEDGDAGGMRTMYGNHVETPAVGGGSGVTGMIRAKGHPSDLAPVSVTPGFEVSEVHAVSISAGGAVVEKPSGRKMTGAQVEKLVVGEGVGVGGMRTMSGNHAETLGSGGDAGANGSFTRKGVRKERSRDVRIKSIDTTATTTVIYGRLCHGVDCESTASCPIGTWVQKCDSQPTNGGDGCRISEDDGVCFAHTNVKAKVHCGYTRTSSVESKAMYLDNQLISASCGSRQVVSCSTFKCGLTSSFYPAPSDGNTCRMDAVRSRSGPGARVYAICIQERPRITSGTCESAGFEIITDIGECEAEAEFMDIPFTRMVETWQNHDAFPGGCIYTPNGLHDLAYLAFNPINAMTQNAPCGKTRLFDGFFYDCICKKPAAPG